jgi:hypothetical protein
VHNTNDMSFSSVDDTACTNINNSTLVVIYALDVDSTIGLKHNAYVVTGNATICTSIYKRSEISWCYLWSDTLYYVQAVWAEHLEFLDKTLWIFPGGSGVEVLLCCMN